MTKEQKRLEYLRGELRAARISYGELSELQDLVPFIADGDIELLEAAGVPEFPEEQPERTKGDDDGQEYGDPRDYRDGKE